MDSFEQLTHRQQLARVRRAAIDALGQFGIDNYELRLVFHGFNTTYRVTFGDGDIAALRINLNSLGLLNEVAAEVEWVASLRGRSAFTVPEPIFAADGSPAVVVEIDGLEGARPAVLYRWLPGPDLGDRVSAPAYRAIGIAMAHLHKITEQGHRRLATRRPALNAVMLNDPDRLGDPHPAVSSSQRRFLVDIAAQLDEQLAPVFAGPTQLLHADLHGGNVKWHRGELAIFDFDDSGVGAPLQDLAISAFYVRDNPALEAAMIEGYTSVRSLPGAGAEYEALVANRQLHLINFVIGSVNADMVDFAGPYVKKSIGRLKAYLRTGRFELQ